MLELFESFCDIVWHGYVDLSSLVVPIQRDSNVPSSAPLYCHSVIFLNGVIEVYFVLFAHVFYSKIVDNKSELDWSPIVCQKPGDQFSLSSASLVESLFQKLIC